jgi:hypothetical protein
MLGIAGFNREIAMVAKIKPSADTAMIIMRRLRFFAAIPTRGTSIEERFDANPAGRTIVSSFSFRCGITVGSKLSKCATEVHHRPCRAYEWHSGGDDDENETNCFHDEIVSRFVLKILTAYVLKVWCSGSGASSPIPVKGHRAIMTVNYRESPAPANSC